MNQIETEFIQFVLSDRFPWYSQPTTSNRFMFFGHTLMNRNPEVKPVNGIINSQYYFMFEQLFARFCEENDIKVNNILRACVNTTLYDPAEVNEIHVDHDFEHYNFLMYLNEFDNGQTLIYDKDDNIVQTIFPKKYDVVIFGGERHAHRHCGVGQKRVVLVITFN
jgi:hypothetical protein